MYRNGQLRDILGLGVLVLVALEAILAVVLTGFTGAAADGFQHKLPCSVPSKLAYNLAISIITFIVLPTCYLASHFYPDFCRATFGTLSRHVEAAMHGVFLVLWAAALGTSFLTCSDLCGACSQVTASYVAYAGKCCNCAGADGSVEDFCGIDPRPVTYFERVHHWYQATRGLDLTVMLLFVLSTAAMLCLRFVGRAQERRRDGPEAHDLPSIVEEDEGERQGALGDAQPPKYTASAVGQIPHGDL